MTGLIYKELHTNRKQLWAVALAAPLMLLLMMGMVLLQDAAAGESVQSAFADLIGADEDGGWGISMLHMYCAIVPFSIGGIYSVTAFTVDETKRWGFFTASHPKGIKGAVYAKYLLIAGISLITFVSVTLNEYILMLLQHLILGSPREEMITYSTLYMLLFYLQIFLRAIDIPFIIRFGHKRGDSVKAAILGGIIVAVFIYALFGPLPGGEGGDPFVALYDWWTQFNEGKAGAWIYTLLIGFLWLTLAGYYLSYRISCKLYLKGVEQYDK